MKAMFCFSNSDAEHHREDAQRDRGDPRDAQFGRAVGLALPEHAWRRGRADTAEAPDSVRPDDHRQDGREGHRRDEAEEHVAADRLGQMDRRHVAAAEQRALESSPDTIVGLVSTNVIAPKPMMKVRM